MVFRRCLIASLSLHAAAMAGVAWLSFGASENFARHPGLEVGVLEHAVAAAELPPEPLPPPEPPAYEDPAPLPKDVPFEEPAHSWESDPPLQTLFADSRALERMPGKSLKLPGEPSEELLAVAASEQSSPAEAPAPAPHSAVSATPVAAVLMDAPPPAYPRASLRLGEEGSVRLELEIGLDGKVCAVNLLESSGHPRLDKAALEAVAQWRFTPASLDGAPIAGRMVHVITFRIT